jgi:hypothetical protein
MSTSFDYEKLYATFADLLEDKLLLTMVELTGDGDMPPTPFISFGIVSPYIPISEFEDSREFESWVSFTAYGHTQVSSLNTAQRVRDLFGDSLVISDLSSQDIVVIERQAMQNRATLEPAMPSFMTGFDMHLRLKTPYETTAGPINGIVTEGGVKPDE